MPPENPAQVVYGDRRIPLLQRAQSLIDSLPDAVRSSANSPYVRYAWEARDTLIDLVAENKRLHSRLATIRREALLKDGDIADGA